MSWDNIGEELLKMASDMVTETKKVAAETTLDNLTEKAPILTGNLNANTIVTLNAPTYVTNELKDTTRFNTYLAGMSAVNKSKAYDIIYIQNNTEYNYLIEFESWSKKAPNGYFEISVENMYRVIERL